MNAGCGRNYFAIDDRIGPRRFEIINLFYILGVPCFFKNNSLHAWRSFAVCYYNKVRLLQTTRRYYVKTTNANSEVTDKHRVIYTSYWNYDNYNRDRLINGVNFFLWKSDFLKIGHNRTRNELQNKLFSLIEISFWFNPYPSLVKILRVERFIVSFGGWS